jgi:hypothetical protein
MLQNEDYLKRLIRRIDELDEEINRERRAQARQRKLRRRRQFQAWLKKIFKIKDKNAE